MLAFLPFIGNKSKGQEKQNTALAQHFLNQLMNEQAFIGKNSFNFGFDTLNQAKGDIGYLQDFFKNILEGEDRDALLDFVDTDKLNADYANAESTATELGPRGGLRASTLSNLNFEKMSEIQNLLQGVKSKSPEALMQLIQMLGGLSGQALGTSANAYGLGMQGVGTALQINEANKDRRAALIGGLISAAGAVAGTAAGKIG